jgi:hypothetical protein
VKNEVFGISEELLLAGALAKLRGRSMGTAQSYGRALYKHPIQKSKFK